MAADGEAEQSLQERAAEAVRQLLDTPALRRLVEIACRLTDPPGDDPPADS
jgi:hypothetical protein